MNAKIHVRNVGGLDGEHEYSFDSGEINFIEAPNAAGKSSLIQALVASLSVPEENLEGKFLQAAKRLNVRSDSTDTQEGFVNIHEESAQVELEIEGETYTYEVSRDGTIREAPGGDERFLLAGVLNANAKIVNDLMGGETDFSWIVNDLSLAQYYDEYLEYARQYQENIERNKTDAEKTIERIQELNEEIQEKQERKEVFEERRERLSEELTAEEQKKIDKREQITTRINSRRSNIEERRGRIDSLEEQKREAAERIEEINGETENKREKLESIDLKEIEQEVEKRVAELQEKQSQIQEERDEERGQLQVFRSAFDNLAFEESDTVTCPICEESQLSVSRLNETVNEKEEEVQELSTQIANIGEEIEEERHRVAKARNKKQQLEEDISNLETRKQSREDRISEIDREIQALKNQIEEDKEKNEEDKARLEEIRQEIEKTDEELNEELNEIEGEVSDIVDEISAAKRRKERAAGGFELLDREVDPETAIEVYEEWLEFFDDVLRYVREKRHEHREKAKDEFNENINDLMEELGFEDFRSVRLNENNELVVERRGHRVQPVNTLSTSERHTISTLLIIALKDTYLPDIPFLVLDDVILDFDEDRKEKILDHLQRLAEQNDWYVVISRLNEEEEGISIKNRTESPTAAD